MRWRLARVAEVARRGDQRLAEELCPHPVDQHTRRERIGSFGDSGGEFLSPTAIREWHRLVWRQHSQKVPRFHWPLALDVASKEYRKILNLVAVLDDVNRCWSHVGGLRVGFFNSAIGSAIDHARTGEHAGHRVVIAHRDRIELVIVASSASDGKPKKRARHRSDS